MYTVTDSAYNFILAKQYLVLALLDQEKDENSHILSQQWAVISPQELALLAPP